MDGDPGERKLVSAKAKKLDPLNVQIHRASVYLPNGVRRTFSYARLCGTYRTRCDQQLLLGRKLCLCAGDKSGLGRGRALPAFEFGGRGHCGKQERTLALDAGRRAERIVICSNTE